MGLWQKCILVNYSETDDQAAFTQIFDMATARRANSFDKCYRDIRRMLEKLKQS